MTLPWTWEPRASNKGGSHSHHSQGPTCGVVSLYDPTTPDLEVLAPKRDMLVSGDTAKDLFKNEPWFLPKHSTLLVLRGQQTRKNMNERLALR